MKSLIKFAAIAAFVAASVGIVACNNNTRSLRSGAPGAEDVVKPETAVDPVVEATEDPDVAQYTLAMIDQQDSTKTFPVQGQLHKTLENASYFSFLPEMSGPSFVYVVRVAPIGDDGSGSRDFAFVFEEGENMRLSTGTLYVEHQDLDNYLYKVPFISIPNFAILADRYNTTKEQLMNHMADFVNSQKPEIVKPGIQYIDGHTLPDNIVDLWIIAYENFAGLNI